MTALIPMFAAAAGAAGETTEVIWYLDPTFWFALALVGFFAVLAALGVFRKIAEKLDERSAAIRDQFDEARGLREEGQALLAKYQRRQRDAKEEAEAIIEQAKKDAGIMLEQADRDISVLIDRREQLAAQKIDQMEANAVKAVRAAAAAASISAARKIIAEQMDGKAGSTSIDDAIAGLDTKLH